MTADPEDIAAAAEAAGDPRLAELARLTRELQAAEQDVEGWRERRNREILRLRGLPDPPGVAKIGRVAGIKHTLVSRIATNDGRPPSGH